MNRLTGILLAALMLAAGTPVVSADVSPVEALLKAAREKSKGNDVEAAREAFGKVLAAPEATVSQKITAYSEIARVLLAKKQFSTAVQEYEKALALPALPPAERFKLLNRIAAAHFSSNFDGAFASYSTDGIDAAASVYGKIAAEPDTDNPTRIAALKGLADCLLEKLDVNAANAALERAVALPNLRPEEKNVAVLNQARALHRQCEYGRARKLCEELLAGDPKNLKGDLERLVAATQAAEKFEEPIPQRFEEGLPDVDGLQQTLANPQADDRTRWAAFEKILPLWVVRRDFDDIKKSYEAHWPGFQGKDPKRGSPLIRLPGHYQLKNLLSSQPDFMVWLSKAVLESRNLPEKDAQTFRRHLFDALLGQRKATEAAQVAQEALNAPALSPALKLQWQLVLVALKAPEAPAELAKAAEAALAAFQPEEVPAKERSEAVLYAEKAAMRAELYNAVAALEKVREGMLAPEPRRSIACEFLVDAPGDISGFLASPLWNDAAKRGRLDRKYGDNLQFLIETDSSTVGRKVGDKDAKTLGPAEFVVTCDTDGVRIFTLAKSDKLAEISDGFAGMGGYEMYVAPGEHQAYFCFLVDNGKLSDGFVTQYNNRHFRQALLKDGTLRCVSRITPKGLATLVSLSWELFWDKLPEDGDTWQFDAIHWEGGGYSWGGTKTVHGRSGFGDLIFANMTRENRNAIKRRLVVKALDRYNREKRANLNGVLDYWQDPRLGDRAFYRESLEPRVARLDAVAARVRKGMSDEDVEAIFAEAVPAWMTIPYVVADLRRDYLERKRIAGE